MRATSEAAQLFFVRARFKRRAPNRINFTILCRFVAAQLKFDRYGDAYLAICDDRQESRVASQQDFRP
jgi:hypothetical protein